MSHHTDEAIRALIANVARATVELCAERMIERYTAHTIARDLLRMKHQLAEEIVEASMECADESPESEVHAVRALAKGGA
ncbi:MAG: hypothetical protein ABL993_02410 [Vicinamibacterales bacterium]